MNFRYYFGFTKGQYKGLFFLLAINLCVIIYYFVDDSLYKVKPAHDFSELIVYLDSVESSQSIVLVDSFYDFDRRYILKHRWLHKQVEFSNTVCCMLAPNQGEQQNKKLLLLVGVDQFLLVLKCLLFLKLYQFPEKKPIDFHIEMKVLLFKKSYSLTFY